MSKVLLMQRWQVTEEGKVRILPDIVKGEVMPWAEYTLTELRAMFWALDQATKSANPCIGAAKAALPPATGSACLGGSLPCGSQEYSILKDKLVIVRFMEMCQESLDPERYEKAEDIRDTLNKTRKGLSGQ